MKPTVTILVCVVAAGLASAQSPKIILNTRSTTNTVSNHAAAAASHEKPAPPQTAAMPARATHAPAKASGVAVVTPLKSSAARPSSEAARHMGGRRRVWAVPVVGSLPATPADADPENNPPTVASAADKGVQETAVGENAASGQPVVPDGKYGANGRRDPFLSPVVSHAGGSGCSTGKKCLEIGTINLRGVVRAESGFIAVVSNGLNKAYFLRENDPVFNGYVMKITGDSIVFQETLQDRLGKTVTREVVKKITTPAV